MEEKVQVIIIEDDPNFTNNLKSCITNLHDFKLLKAYDSCETALKDTLFKNAQILLLDIKLIGMDGITAIPHFLQINPDLKIIMVSSFNHDKKLFEALRLGAKGYLLKTDCFQFLENALLQVLIGGMLFSPEMAKKVLKHFKRKSFLKEKLTKREKEILKLLKLGLTKKEIAGNLQISYGTVDTHVKNIYKKLQVNNKIQASNIAASFGIN